MASYEELHALMGNTDLLDKVAVCVVFSINQINTDKTGTPPTNQPQREIWANEALKDPQGMAKRFLPLMLVKYGTGAVTVQDIIDLTDAQLQTGVDSVIDLFAGT